MKAIRWCWVALVWALASPSALLAQVEEPPALPNKAGKPAERSLTQWLIRMHEASKHHAYAGTFVVSSATGGMFSSRIWHVCEGEQQIERVESLTGAPRSTFRLDDQVVTFLPQSGQVLQERRESLRIFPGMLKGRDASISEYYAARFLGNDRVAGVDTEVVLLEPRDRMRFGYRVWSERDTGLVVKLQTLDLAGHTLEQSAFSELQLENVPVSRGQLIEMMHNTHGYHVERIDPVATTAAAEGWVLKPAVAGFKLMSCLLRPFAVLPKPPGATTPGKGPATRTVQWIFSDGLATVSMFVEPLDRQGRNEEVSLVVGATHLLSRRVQDWWLTVVGEVPLPTLQALARGIERAH